MKLTQEPLQHVDGTPDIEYPIRILRAHRQKAIKILEEHKYGSL